MVYALQEWYWWANHSWLEPITKLARTIKEHREGIFNDAKSRVNNGVPEGLNSLNKAAAARARGCKTVHNAIIAY